MIVVVMGVTGCGKTTVGKLVANHLGLPYIEGDQYHPKENILKMSNGIPLTDEDRYPWLRALSRELQVYEKQKGAVLACSALKEHYREILQQGLHEQINWIYLEGSEETLRERIKNRNGHFMPEGLLRSQLETLEIPAYAYTFSIEKQPEKIAAKIADIIG
jgi:carbohydrate kinase (thermoresistant glucokinase family)